jgi:hypothetical protein
MGLMAASSDRPEVVTVTVEQLNWLLDGYDIWTQPHQMLKFQHAS